MTHKEPGFVSAPARALREEEPASFVGAPCENQESARTLIGIMNEHGDVSSMIRAHPEEPDNRSMDQLHVPLGNGTKAVLSKADVNRLLLHYKDGCEARGLSAEEPMCGPCRAKAAARR